MPAPVCGVVALHPERTDDPATVRWEVGHALDGITDPPAASVVEPLRRLVNDGVLAGFGVRSGHVWTSLAPARAWAQAGPVVRRAVQEAVRAHEQELHLAAPDARDDLLGRVARQVVTEVVAPVAILHGGSIEFVEARDAVVVVRLRGACHGCPASSGTLHGLLERELRARVPWLARVQEAPDDGARRTGWAIGALRRRPSP